MQVAQKTKDSWHMVQQSYSWAYTQKRQELVGKNTYTPMFIVALFTIAKMWKQSKCPSTDEQIKKMWCVCIGIHTNGIYSAIKNNETMPFASTQMNLEFIILNEIYHTKANIVSLMWNLKKMTQMNLFTKQNHRSRKQI